MPRPNTFIFHITFKCNLMCDYCDYRTERIDDKSYKVRCFGNEFTISQDYPWAFWLTVLNRFRPYHLEFTGGEPTIYDGMAELIDHLPRDASWAMTSNTLKADVIRKIRAHQNVQWTASYHFRQKETFMENVSTLRRKGFKVSVTMVLTPDNSERVEEMACELAEKNIQSNIHPILKQGFDWNEHRDIYNRLKNLPIKLKSKSKLINFVYNIRSEFKPDGAVKSCPSGTNYFCLFPDGRVWRCVSLSILGNKEPMGKIENLIPNKLDHPCDGGCIFPCDMDCRDRKWRDD